MTSRIPSKREAKKHRARHPKSRNGCYTCKARRVKCDEAKPICGACASRHETCEFPAAFTPRWYQSVTADQASSEFPASGEVEATEPMRRPANPPESSNSASPHALQFDLGLSVVSGNLSGKEHQSLNMVDLQLLSHFITNTSKKMTLKPSKRLIWERVIPEFAARHEFLMRLLLALAGLDYYYPDGSQKKKESHRQSSQGHQTPSSGMPPSPNQIDAAHLEVIIAHHQIGLQGFREELANLSTSNCNEVFVGSMLLVGFAFASLRVRNMNDTLSTSSHAEHAQAVHPRLDWIYLVRGLTTVVKNHWLDVRKGLLREMLQFMYLNDDWKLYPQEMFTAVSPSHQHWSQRLARFCTGSYAALADLKSFQESIDPVNDLAFLKIPSSSQPPDEARLNGVLSDQKSTIHVLEQMYLRVLYVAQMSRSLHASAFDVQADIEDAGVMSWPEMIPGRFLASLDGFGALSHLSYTILAYLYLTFSLLEDYWFVKGAFDEDIIKIEVLVGLSGNEELIELMEWPVSVLGS